MTSSFFLPPPFPFPEAWPRVFAEQQQRQERKWLMPNMTYSPVQWQTPATSESYRPLDEGISSVVVATCSDVQQDTCRNDEEDGDDAYEYGYILSEEWRERFQSSFRLQEQMKSTTIKNKKKAQKKKKKKKKTIKGQTLNVETFTALEASRSNHLQHTIHAAKIRELARKWKLQDNAETSAPSPKTSQVAALETCLNMRFDDFCDACQPVVWPHDSVERSS